MNKSPFDNLPTLSQRKAIEILSTEVSKLNLFSDYYKAAFHLAKYPGIKSEEALIRLVLSKGSETAFVIGRRMAVSSLAKLGCTRAIPVIGSCLDSEDPYLIENSAWALKELNCKDPVLLDKLINLLDDTKQNRRTLIKAISHLSEASLIKRIKELTLDSRAPTGVRGAAIAAIVKSSKEKKLIGVLHQNLKLKSQNERHCAVYDLVDTGDFDQLKFILKSPISPSFRLNAVKSLWPKNKENNNGLDLFEVIESLIMDNPNEINTLHNYEQDDDDNFLVNELFGTDFSRCYSVLKILATRESSRIWPVLNEQLNRATKDYGAMYFLILLFSLKSDWDPSQSIEIERFTLFALGKSWPEYMKFRPISIVNLMKINKICFLGKYKSFLDVTITPFWVSRYATLMSLELLFKERVLTNAFDRLKMFDNEPNWLVKIKMDSILRTYP